jgi:hypothetical protein
MRQAHSLRQCSVVYEQDLICARPQTCECLWKRGLHDARLPNRGTTSTGSSSRAVIERLFLEAPNVNRYDAPFVFEPVKVGLGIPLRPARRGRE